MVCGTGTGHHTLCLSQQIVAEQAHQVGATLAKSGTKVDESKLGDGAKVRLPIDLDGCKFHP